MIPVWEDMWVSLKQKTKFAVYSSGPVAIMILKGLLGAEEVCQMSKSARNTRVGLLSHSVPSRPIEKIHIDYVGKLPRSKRGNQFILVAVDSSKFWWLCPVRDSISMATMQALDTDIFQNFGFPSI